MKPKELVRAFRIWWTKMGFDLGISPKPAEIRISNDVGFLLYEVTKTDSEYFGQHFSYQFIGPTDSMAFHGVPVVISEDGMTVEYLESMMDEDGTPANKFKKWDSQEHRRRPMPSA